MIDFNNSSFVKLAPADAEATAQELAGLLIEGERVAAAFRGMRDYVAFTDKRLIVVNVQGITGKKKDFTSLPYNKIQSFSVETAGTFDLDAELDLWFSGLGKVRLEFTSSVDIRWISQFIGYYTL
ncbi:PH domain-containing protein [Zhihengliuella flava]|uniref:Bacterial Pleckstrin homology domain-containing protein n=1 Tax=Zhihengliuella flava TaxID=1285193 RepID=A0A931D9E7_9MICC|nr:PH domain-containing protein [Zhihengliuella flava]MBG6084417.1 hypothetical protein [Zhihengliuella flava]